MKYQCGRTYKQCKRCKKYKNCQHGGMDPYEKKSNVLDDIFYFDDFKDSDYEEEKHIEKICTLPVGNYKISKRLGYGDEGVVYRLLLNNKKGYIIKQFHKPKNHNYKDFMYNYNTFSKFLDKYKNIISLPDYKCIGTNNLNHLIFIVMDEYPKTLKDLPEKEQITYLKQLLPILNDMLDHNMTDMDFSLRNIMIDKNGKMIWVDYDFTDNIDDTEDKYEIIEFVKKKLKELE